MFFSLFVILLTIVLFVILFDFLIRKYTNYGLAISMPGPYMYPIVGSLDFIGLSQDQAFRMGTENAKKYPSGYRYWTFGIFIYTIHSADSFEKIATNSKHISKSFSYKFLEGFLGKGLLTSSGEKWFQRRKLLTPAFHFSVLKSFQSTFSEQTAILIDEIRRTEANRPDGTNLQKIISRFTLNTICESAMGVKMTKPNELDGYRNQINQIGKYQVKRFTTPWQTLDFTYKWLGEGRNEAKVVQRLHQFTGEIIDKRREIFLSQQQKDENLINDDVGGVNDDVPRKQRYAMLDTLLMAECKDNQIDAHGIQEEVNTFVFEGYDTTMTAITFTLFMIAHHDDVQQKLFNEINEIVATGGKVKDVTEMKYLDCVIKESLRLYPPVPFIGRVLGEDTILDNIKLPANTIIHILIYAIHRDPKYFPDPEKFNPMRFSTENEHEKHNFAYVPFSAGQRNCIGQKFAMMEIKTVISEILWNFNLKPITKVEDLIFCSDLILRTKNPIRIQFLPRF